MNQMDGQKMKESMIPIGQFLFKWRNILFPVIVFGLFALTVPAKTILGSARAESLLDATAITIIALGVLIRLMVIGFFEVKRNGKKKVAHADEPFTGGMFGISRNSLYLGNLTIYAGVFLLHGTPVVFILGMAAFLFIYYAIIFSEEAFLADEFGEAFTSYYNAVPRLLPKLSNWGAATKDMSFSWKRAIYGEYNIIGQAVLMVALALWYESYSLTGMAAMPVSVAVVMIAGIAFVLTIRTLKRR